MVFKYSDVRELDQWQYHHERPQRVLCSSIHVMLGCVCAQNILDTHHRFGDEDDEEEEESQRCMMMGSLGLAGENEQ